MKKNFCYLLSISGMILFSLLLFTCASPLENNRSGISGENESTVNTRTSARPAILWRVYMEEINYYPDSYSYFIIVEIKDAHVWCIGKWEILFCFDHKVKYVSGRRVTWQQEGRTLYIRGEGDPDNIRINLSKWYTKNAFPRPCYDFNLNGNICIVTYKKEPTLFYDVGYQGSPYNPDPIYRAGVFVCNMPDWWDNDWLIILCHPRKVRKVSGIPGDDIEWKQSGNILYIRGRGPLHGRTITIEATYDGCPKPACYSPNVNNTLCALIYTNPWTEWYPCP